MTELLEGVPVSELGRLLFHDRDQAVEHVALADRALAERWARRPFRRAA